MDAANSKADEVARRKRVNLYKKAIISLIVILLLIPLFLCIVLFIKVNKLENLMNKMVEQKENSYVGTANREVELENIDLEDTEGKKIYLTFDDGPSENTDKILAILKHYNAKATFFVNGRTDEKSLERYKAIIIEGHTLGLHSYSHDYSKVYKSVESFALEFDQLKNLLYNTTGVEVKLIRFPGGSSNNATGSIPIEDFIRYVNQQGYRYFDWNVSSGDGANKVLEAKQIVDNIIKNVDNVNNPVVLLHDTGNKTTTVDALPEIIETLINMGYQPSAIDDTTQPIQHIKAESVN